MKLKEHFESNGLFKVEILHSWKYSLLKERIHTYQEYEIWKSYSFQISFREVTPEHVGIFAKWINGCDSFEELGKVFYRQGETNHGDFATHNWVSQQQNNNIRFTITYSNERDEELDPITDEEKVKLAEKMLPTFELIPEADRENKLNSFRFRNFIRGVGAASYMISKAVANKAFIEATCLIATQIDSILRTAIILQLQINNGNSEIDKQWIYQGLRDRRKSEKDIYRKALELNIITEEINTELYKLYDDRNRVIHRFVISEITLAEVENIAYEYSKMSERINKILYDIEALQIERNVGITRKGDNEEENPIDFFRGKISKNGYFQEEE